MNSQPMRMHVTNNPLLWNILSDDESGASLPYNGSSGWSGTDTSKDRADHADHSGETKSRQRQTIGHLYLSEQQGMTWKELADTTGWHHGQASGALSVLHKVGKIARLKEKRNACRVYVLPEFICGREVDVHGRKPKRTYEQGLRDAVEAVYGDCHHTKYEGCRPCIHDEIAHAIEALGETND
jgi:uncharacterized protein YcaQ